MSTSNSLLWFCVGNYVCECLWIGVLLLHDDYDESWVGREVKKNNFLEIESVSDLFLKGEKREEL